MTSEENLEEVLITQPTTRSIHQWRNGIAWLLSSGCVEKSQNEELFLGGHELIWVKKKCKKKGILLWFQNMSEFLEKWFGLLYLVMHRCLLSVLDLLTDISVAWGFYLEGRLFFAALTLSFPIIAAIVVHRKHLIERHYEKTEGITDIRPNYNKRWDKLFDICKKIPFIKSIYVGVFHSVIEWNCRNLPEKHIKLYDLANYSSSLNRIETIFETVPEVMLQTILFFIDLKHHKSISNDRFFSIFVSVMKTSITFGTIWISKVKYVFLEEDKYWGYIGKSLFYLESATLFVIRVATVNVIFYWLNESIVFSEYYLEIPLFVLWLIIPRMVFAYLTYKSQNIGEKFYFDLRKQHFLSIWSKWITAIFFYPIHPFKLWIFGYVQVEHLIATFVFFYSSLHPKFLIHLIILWVAHLLSILIRFIFVKLVFDSKSRSFLTGYNIVKNCEKAMNSTSREVDEKLDDIDFSKVMETTRVLSNSIIEADKKNQCLSFRPEYKELMLLNHMQKSFLEYYILLSPHLKIYQLVGAIGLISTMITEKEKINKNHKENFSNYFNYKKQIYGDKGNKKIDDPVLKPVLKNTNLEVSLFEYVTHNLTIPAKKLMEYFKLNKPCLSEIQVVRLKEFLINTTEEETKVEAKLSEGQITNLCEYCMKNLYPFSETNQKESKFHKDADEILEKYEPKHKSVSSETIDNYRKKLIKFLWLNCIQFSDLEINNLLDYCSKNLPDISDKFKRKLVKFIRVELPNWEKTDIVYILYYIQRGYLKITRDQLNSLVTYCFSENSKIKEILDGHYLVELQTIYKQLKLWNKTRMNDLIHFCSNNRPYPYNWLFKFLKGILPMSSEAERSQFIQFSKDIGIQQDISEQISENGEDLVMNGAQLKAVIKLTYLRILNITVKYLEILKKSNSEKEQKEIEIVKRFLTSELDFILAHDLMAYESYSFVVPLQIFSSFKFKIKDSCQDVLQSEINASYLLKFYNMSNHKYSDGQLIEFYKLMKLLKRKYKKKENSTAEIIEEDHDASVQFLSIVDQELENFTVFELIDSEFEDQVSYSQLQSRLKAHTELQREYLIKIQDLPQPQLKVELENNYEAQLEPQLLLHLEEYSHIKEEENENEEIDFHTRNFKTFLETYLYLKEDFEKGLEMGETALNFIDEDFDAVEEGEYKYLRNLPSRDISTFTSVTNKTTWIQNFCENK